MGLTISQTMRPVRKKSKFQAFYYVSKMATLLPGQGPLWKKSKEDGCYDFTSHLLRYKLKTDKTRQSVKKKKTFKKGNH